MRTSLCLLLLAVVPACRRRPPPPSSEHAPSSRVTELSWPDDPAWVGLSGAVATSSGTLWIVPERGRFVLRSETRALLAGDAEGARPAELPLVGVPEGTDVEGVALADADHLYLATEARGSRDGDPIYVARLESERVVVEDQLMFTYAPFGQNGGDNEGLEGVCSGSGWLVAASEAVAAEDEERWALVGVWDGPRMKPIRVQLTSQKGKLSGLACRATAEQIEVHAIERHFGTMRVVRFVLPRTVPQPVESMDSKGDHANPLDVRAEVVKDLASDLGPKPPNLEALTWVGPTTLLALSDNHYGERTGPTRAYRIDISTRDN